MKEIPLSQGKVALVDDEDYDRLMEKKWHAYFQCHSWYAKSNLRVTKDGKKCYTTLYIHRYILKLPNGRFPGVDHIDGNGLNNLKNNLRMCTQSQNMWNSRIGRNNKSGYKGVSWDTECGKWRVCIMHKRKSIRLGRHSNLIEAAKIYDKKAKELFGEYALLNFPGG